MDVFTITPQSALVLQGALSALCRCFGGLRLRRLALAARLLGVRAEVCGVQTMTCGDDRREGELDCEWILKYLWLIYDTGMDVM